MAANDAARAQGTSERRYPPLPQSASDRRQAVRPAPSPAPAATGASPSGASSSGTTKMAARWRIAIAPKGGATSSAVATMPGSVSPQPRPMNAVMAPASASARRGRAERAERDDQLGTRAGSAQRDDDRAPGTAAATSAIRPNVAKAWA